MSSKLSNESSGYEPVIGLEIHAQLSTRSKMFCGCSAAYQNAPPNTLVCPICLGLPGALPVINRAALEMVVMTGLALGSEISTHTKFDRKNYAYPDLMKGYQISQYDLPVCLGGHIEIELEGTHRPINLTRIHLEEDVAKLLHRRGNGDEPHSLLDINRSGVPLMEIVSEPDFRSPEEARIFLVELRSILRYLGVSAANMEEGNFRCDANISIRPMGSNELYPKVEIKNMNSFRAVQKALTYEIGRQINLISSGETVIQATRGWLEEKGITVAQRTKESAHDYRYFPEPDLPSLTINSKTVSRLRAHLPELPRAKRQRFIKEYELPAYDAGFLTETKEMADWFELSLKTKPLKGEALRGRAKVTSNWMLGELARLLNAHHIEMRAVTLPPSYLSRLVDLVEAGALNTPMAKEIFEKMFLTGTSPDKLLGTKDYVPLTNEAELASSIDAAIESNPLAVQDYLGGKEPALQFLVGQVMKITRGKASPSLARNLLQDRLDPKQKAT